MRGDKLSCLLCGLGPMRASCNAAGGEEIGYESCTEQTEELGLMGGSFTFVMGSIRRPTGPEFLVQVSCL